MQIALPAHFYLLNTLAHDHDQIVVDLRAVPALTLDGEDRVNVHFNGHWYAIRVADHGDIFHLWFKARDSLAAERA